MDLLSLAGAELSTYREDSVDEADAMSDSSQTASNLLRENWVVQTKGPSIYSEVPTDSSEEVEGYQESPKEQSDVMLHNVFGSFKEDNTDPPQEGDPAQHSSLFDELKRLTTAEFIHCFSKHF
jgi:hypothetical protein